MKSNNSNTTKKPVFGGLYDIQSTDTIVGTTENDNKDSKTDSDLKVNSPTSTNNNNNNNSKNSENTSTEKKLSTVTIPEGFKLPPKLLQAAKRNKQTLNKSNTSASSNVSPVVNTNTNNNNTSNIKKEKENVNVESPQNISQSFQQQHQQHQPQHQHQPQQHQQQKSFIEEEEVLDEYNPFKPNDYEDYLKEKAYNEKMRMMRMEEERNQQMHHHHHHQQQQHHQHQHHHQQQQHRETPLVMMDEDITGDEVYQRRAKLSQPSSNVKPREKISTIPTKILLLTNIVTKDELDDEAIEDIEKECSKYGDVRNVVVGEASSSVDDIGIFVQFETADQSKQAYSQLNDRYFAKKKVKTYFYNEDLFHQGVLS